MPVVPEVDEWRSQVLTLLQGLSEPLQVLMIVAAFTLGLLAVRAID